MARQKQKHKKTVIKKKEDKKVPLQMQKGRSADHTAGRAINELKVLAHHLHKCDPGLYSSVSIVHERFLENDEVWICKMSMVVHGSELRALGRGEKLESKAAAAFDLLKALLPSCSSLEDMTTTIRSMRKGATHP